VQDKRILQREATGGSPLLQNLAYVLCGLIAVVWIASMAWGLRRLDLREGRRRLVESRREPLTASPTPHRRAG
jgi:hypothetical protein